MQHFVRLARARAIFVALVAAAAVGGAMSCGDTGEPAASQALPSAAANVAAVPPASGVERAAISNEAEAATRGDPVVPGDDAPAAVVPVAAPTAGGQSRVILNALTKYGMIVADQGTSWFITGAADTRWDDDDLNQLKTVPGSAFEVVQLGQVYTYP